MRFEMKEKSTIKNVYFIFVCLIIFSEHLQAQSGCPQGMISYWKLDEIGNVTTFLDSYGNHNGSCSESSEPTEAVGIINKARNFLGNSEIKVPNDSVFDWGNNTGFSIEAWIKTTQNDSSNKVIIGAHEGTLTSAWWLGLDSNNTAIFSVRDSKRISAEVRGTTEINDDKWHHIVGVRENNKNVLQIFVDGHKENEINAVFSGNFSGGTNPIYIGFYINSYYYNGLLDEVAIYRTVLTTSEIRSHYNNGLNGIGYCGDVSGITAEVETGIPKEFSLIQNYPNPFNPSTTIKYSLPEETHVALKVFDILANKIETLIDEKKPAGTYEIKWNASTLPSGVYFYQLRAGDFIQTKKMVFMK